MTFQGPGTNLLVTEYRIEYSTPTHKFPDGGTVLLPIFGVIVGIRCGDTGTFSPTSSTSSPPSLTEERTERESEVPSLTC